MYGLLRVNKQLSLNLFNIVRVLLPGTVLLISVLPEIFNNFPSGADIIGSMSLHYSALFALTQIPDSLLNKPILPPVPISFLNKWKIFLLLLFIQSPVIWAQQPLLRHYSTMDGLPSNVVYDVFQDSKRFLWFCTDQGVSRFDGHSFENFSSKSGLPDNEIFRVQEDDLHRLWLVCYDHKACYIQDGKVYNSSNSSICREIEKAGIDYELLFKNSDGKWCLGGRKTCMLNEHAITVSAATYEQDIADYFTYDGITYTLNRGFFARIENGRRTVLLERKFKTIYHYHNKIFLCHTDIKNGFLDITLEGKKVKIEHELIPPAWINAFYALSDSTIICGTEKGTLLYNPRSATFSRSLLLPENIAVNRILKDHEGNIWFTTLNNGVYMQLAASPYVYNKMSGMKSDVILTAGIVGHKVMAGYDDGFSIISPDNAIRNYALKSATHRNRIKFVFQTPDPDQYLVASDYGLYLLNKSSQTSLRIFRLAHKDGYSNGRDNYLLGTASNAYAYDFHKKILTTIWYKRTTAIIKSDETIWMGTLDGVYYKTPTDSAKKLHTDSTLSHSRITSLSLLQDKLVITTSNNGLFIYDKNHPLIHLDELSGISNNNCKKAITDKNNIWLNTGSGLDKICLSDHTITGIYQYSPSDGLVTDNINDISILNDKLYVATNDGLIILHTTNKEVMQKPPLIYLSSIMIRNVLYHEVRPMVLDHTQNDIQVNFTGISFAGGQDIEYKYTLGNSDTTYTKLGTVNFSALQPGRYQFSVWARVKHGIWTTTPASFSFLIKTPFWKTYWFIISCILFVLLLILYYGIWKFMRIRSQAEEKAIRQRQMTELELQALRAQINPHFLFNALNSIQNYYSNNDERKANYYLTSFAGFIRKTLTYSKSQWIALPEEISLMKTYIELEQMRFKNVFSFEISVSDSLNQAKMKVPAMLIQPYVENAINHGFRNLSGRPGELLLHFETKEGVLICVIDDNGIGVIKSQKVRKNGHQSLGMSISSQRIETINQLYQTSIAVRIIDKASLFPAATGTRIEIRIPQKETYEENDHHNY